MIQVKKLPIIQSWLRWLLAFSLLLAFPQSSWAAETAEYYEQIYLSPSAALKTVFGDLSVSTETLSLSTAQHKALQRQLRRKIPEAQFTIYAGKRQGKIERYALILDEKGKHYPITFIVALSPQASVEQVAVMVYREKRGDGVKRQRFLNQFRDKAAADRIEINRDIVHITGSTISSWSIAAGVRKAVTLLEMHLK